MQQHTTEDDYSHVAYNINLLDNGIVIEDREFGYAECEKYSNFGKRDDKTVIRFIGKKIWNDIRDFTDKTLSSHEGIFE